MSHISAFLLFLLLCATTTAQAQTLARFSLDSTVGVSKFVGDKAARRPQLIVEINTSMRLGDRWQIYVRPWFAFLSSTEEWEAEIYQAAVRYERSGRLAVRLEAGYIASPVGLAMLDTNPSVNPTIAPHFNYILPMLPFNPGGARVGAIASSYPLGTVLTLSTDRWDARAAVVNTAPSRSYRIRDEPNPLSTPVFEAGAGITPTPGLRFGVSLARGAYLTAAELTAPNSNDRQLTMVGLEGEYAFRYTKISGEIIRDAFETQTDTAIAYAWFIQGTQTISPRWFVAARQEGTSAPLFGTGAAFVSRSHLETAEATVGFRVAPEITLRGGYFSRKFYSRTWDHQIGASIVWARRWW